MEQRKPADPHLLVWLQDQSGGGGGVLMAHEEVIHDEVSRYSMSNSRSRTNCNLTQHQGLKGMCQYIRATFTKC